jgi:uncharacterized metal-binding protein
LGEVILLVKELGYQRIGLAFCTLCVGHDAIFSKISKAPVTTLVAKDRVLAHNPAGAIYSRYIRKHFKGTA